MRWTPESAGPDMDRGARREEGADRKSSDQKLEEGSTTLKLQDARRNDGLVYRREVGGVERGDRSHVK